MKIPFSRKDSRLIIFLMILILVLLVRSGKYTYLVNALFFGTLTFYYSPYLTKLTARYFAVFIFFTFWGIIRGNNLIYIIEDLFSFAPIILLFIEKPQIRNDIDKRLPIYLANSLIFLIPISCLIYVYMGYSFGSIDVSRFNYNQEIKMALMGPIIPLLFAPYLVFYSESFNKKQLYLVHTANLIFGLFGVITLTKSVVLTAVTPYLIYLIFKLLKFNFRPLFKWILLIFIIITTTIQTGIIKQTGLSISIEGLIARSIEGIESSNFDNNRFQETTDYLNQDLDILEYLFGRGMGGQKVRNDSDEYIGGINMMHIGPSHVFIKGGIILLIIMYVPIFLAIIKFWNTNNYPISLILLLFLIGNIQTTSWSWSITLFLYWYGISKYFSSKKNDRLTINK